MRLPERLRITEPLRITGQRPAREDAGSLGQRDARWPRADAANVAERHSPGWYRELRERLERLPDGHPSSWQTSDQVARADPGPFRDEGSAPGLRAADQADMWWRPRDPHQAGPDCTDDRAAGGAAGGADDPRASAPAADAEAADSDPGDEGAGPPQPGERRDAVKPARRTADSDDSGQWGEPGGPLAAHSPYRPWFGDGTAADPWFAPRSPQ